MILTVYYKDKPAYVFITSEENITKVIEMIEQKFKYNVGFKIENEKKKEKVK